MKKRIIIVLGILIAAGGIGTGVWYHFKGKVRVEPVILLCMCQK